MAMPSVFQIQDSIIAIIDSTVSGAKVWDRVRIATDDKQYRDYYVNDDNLVNVWFIRRSGFLSEVNSMGTFISVTHTFEIRHFRLIVDNEDNLLASERIFQLDLDLVQAAINQVNDLNLGNQVMHRGFSTFEGIPISASLGINEGHLGVMNLDVVVTDC